MVTIDKKILLLIPLVIVLIITAAWAVYTIIHVNTPVRIGVLLPLIIGAMLPLLSLGGLAPTPGDAGPKEGLDLTLPIVLAMDVAFPLGAFAYAWRILGNRPGTRAAGEVSEKTGTGRVVVEIKQQPRRGRGTHSSAPRDRERDGLRGSGLG